MDGSGHPRKTVTFPHASKAFRKLNPHLFGVGGLPPAQPKRRGRRPAPQTARDEKAGPRRVVVSLVCFRRRALDDDNLSGGCKWLRDAIAASLGLDDGDSRLRFEYFQTLTTGRQGVAVKIDFL